MNRNKLLIVLATALAALGWGQPTNYARQTVNVRAGVVVLESQLTNGVPSNAVPHVWYQLGQDLNVRPAKWAFSSPLAQTVLGTEQFNRWRAIDVNTPAVGTRLTKADAPYWEVLLSSTDDAALARYDVLLLPLSGNAPNAGGIQLTPVERDRLRRFVDQGGILWVDVINDSGFSPGLDLANPVPLPFKFSTPGSTGLDANLDHPLLRFPNGFTIAELLQARNPFTANFFMTSPIDAADLGPADTFLRWIPPDSFRLTPVAGTLGNTSLRAVAEGSIGEGHVVVSTLGISANLNKGFNPAFSNVLQTNRGFRSFSPVADPGFRAAAKFAVNLISLGGDSRTSNSGSRRSGSTSVDVTAPLLRRFDDSQQGGSFQLGDAPALVEGRVVVAKEGRVYVYDAKPDRDLDGDGNPDDGLPDPIGVDADLLWYSQVLGTRVSAPTIVTSPNSPLGGTQIWVTDNDSNVSVFPLQPTGGPLSNVAPATTIQPPNGSVPNPSGPYAPTVQEGIAIITDSAQSNLGQTVGRLWAIDVDRLERLTTTNDWQITNSQRLSEPSAAPAIGYIPIQDASGGMDRVVYSVAQPGTGVQPRPASLASTWLGARGEVPIRRELNGNTMTITTRASYNGLPIYLDTNPRYPSLGLKVTILKPTGEPFTAAEMAQTFDGTVTENPKGTLQMGLRATRPVYDYDGRQTQTTADDVQWRLDYSVDWGQAGSGFGQTAYDNYIRGNIEIPDDQNFARRIIGSPAIGPTGAVFVLASHTTGAQSATFYAFREDRGRGEFSMLSRYDVYGAVTYSLNGASGQADSFPIPPVVSDEDDIVLKTPLRNFLNQPLQNWKFVGGPVVKGDNVFAIASPVKRIFGNDSPTAVLFCFRADPPTATFEIEGTDNSFQIVQPDLSLSTDKATPEQFSVLNQGQFTVEPIPNSTRSRVILTNLASATKGRLRDSINLSMPIIVRRGGSTDTVVEPEALADNGRLIAGRSAGRWTPLQWYSVFNGYNVVAPPQVAGETLYMGGASIFAGLLTSGFGFPIPSRGLITAIAANVSANDEFLRPNSTRPWNNQLYSVIIADPGNPFRDIRVANAFKWPQFAGIESLDDLRIRVLQAALDEKDVTNVAVGDGSLAATGEGSLYVFSKADFIVADSGRISRFDPAGNPLWSTDQTFVTGQEASTGPAGVAQPLSEPTRAYPAGENDLWVVDTGNNRVVKMDASARELRSISEFRIDSQFRPNGLPEQGAPSGSLPGESTKLKRPKDVIAFDTFERRADIPFSNPQDYEIWRHVLIADSGNFRVVELVDRFISDAAGRNLGPVIYTDDQGVQRPALGMLYWHTPEELSGKNYSYNSLARVQVADMNNVPRTVVALAFGNVEPGRGTFGLTGSVQETDRTSGYGGVVLYDGAQTAVITEFVYPAINANTFLREDPPNTWTFSSPPTNEPARRQKFAGIRSVTLRYVTVGNARQLGVMVADTTGVYELVQVPPNNSASPWVVRWMMPNEAYLGMRRRGSAPFDPNEMAGNPRGTIPMYARRLDSGEVLVVNGYVGRRANDARFEGEVLLLDGGFDGDPDDPGFALNKLNLGFQRLSVKFELPPIVGARRLIGPTYAQRQ
ncbi:MAG: hypothetical protein KIT11_11070 [Fimbriimonadaceae bacterium]|nr:hypothetical protein [Fimbriimonadaceae bacterium]QYK55862.1 MAG: hypothetical protein KF733_12740 [Fimbriimonadaceae bacterium]